MIVDHLSQTCHAGVIKGEASLLHALICGVRGIVLPLGSTKRDFLRLVLGTCLSATTQPQQKVLESCTNKAQRFRNKNTVKFLNRHFCAALASQCDWAVIRIRMSIFALTRNQLSTHSHRVPWGWFHLFIYFNVHIPFPLKLLSILVTSWRYVTCGSWLIFSVRSCGTVIAVWIPGFPYLFFKNPTYEFDKVAETVCSDDVLFT